jgi:hypothetical protein
MRKQWLRRLLKTALVKAKHEHASGKTRSCRPDFSTFALGETMKPAIRRYISATYSIAVEHGGHAAARE